MNDDQLLRYSRHILLDEIGIEGQERICAARVLILGAGGLGAPAALYLAASGVGQITVVDDDAVDLTNLQRQIAHTTARVGPPKVASLAQAVTDLNPLAQLQPIAQRADAALLDALLPGHQLVLDCTDNVAIRNLLNQRARQHRVPLVSGAAIRLEGQLCSFTWQADEPCYACLSALFGEQSLTCVEAGVLAPVVGLVGSLQALEALKLLAGMGKNHSGRLLMIDGLGGSFREMKLPKRPDCPVCSQP